MNEITEVVEQVEEPFDYEKEEAQNAKNGRTIFWILVTLFGSAIVITVVEKLWIH